MKHHSVMNIVSCLLLPMGINSYAQNPANDETSVVLFDDFESRPDAPQLLFAVPSADGVVFEWNSSKFASDCTLYISTQTFMGVADAAGHVLRTEGLTIPVACASSSHSLTDLAADRQFYVVMTSQAQGAESAKSNEISLTTSMSAVPTIVSIKALHATGVRILWTAPPDTESTLYHARQSFHDLLSTSPSSDALEDFVAKHSGGTHSHLTMGTPLEIDDLTPGVKYYFLIHSVSKNTQQTANSLEKDHVLRAALNDTGMGFTEGDTTQCVADHIGSQDCLYGLDAQSDNHEDGAFGFVFVKIDEQGEKLSADAPLWACTLDQVTGKSWMNRHPDGFDSNQYTLFQSEYLGEREDRLTGGDDGIWAGEENSQNAHLLLEHLNERVYCGSQHWRLPTREELHSIVHYGNANLAVDKNYFSNMRREFYWSSSPNINEPQSNWGIHFGYGYDYTRSKDKTANVIPVSDGEM